MALEAPHPEGPNYLHLLEVHLVWDHQICVVVDTLVLVALQGLLDQELPLVPWVHPCQGGPLVRQLPMELVVALLQTEHQPKEAPISLRLLDHCCKENVVKERYQERDKYFCYLGGGDFPLSSAIKLSYSLSN